jgi:hypothetical protein
MPPPSQFHAKFDQHRRSAPHRAPACVRPDTSNGVRRASRKAQLALAVGVAYSVTLPTKDHPGGRGSTHRSIGRLIDTLRAADRQKNFVLPAAQFRMQSCALEVQFGS